jgi:hypothetical protein
MCVFKPSWIETPQLVKDGGEIVLEGQVKDGTGRRQHRGIQHTSLEPRGVVKSDLR